MSSWKLAFLTQLLQLIMPITQLKIIVYVFGYWIFVLIAITHLWTEVLNVVATTAETSRETSWTAIEVMTSRADNPLAIIWTITAIAWIQTPSRWCPCRTTGSIIIPIVRHRSRSLCPSTPIAMLRMGTTVATWIRAIWIAIWARAEITIIAAIGVMRTGVTIGPVIWGRTREAIIGVTTVTGVIWGLMAGVVTIEIAKGKG